MNRIVMIMLLSILSIVCEACSRKSPAAPPPPQLQGNWTFDLGNDFSPHVVHVTLSEGPCQIHYGKVVRNRADGPDAHCFNGEAQEKVLVNGTSLNKPLLFQLITTRYSWVKVMLILEEEPNDEDVFKEDFASPMPGAADGTAFGGTLECYEIVTDSYANECPATSHSEGFIVRKVKPNQP